MNDRARYAMGFFIKRGWSPHQAAGIVGNLMAESGLRPTGAVGDKGTAFGIAQWRNERLANLKNFAARQGTDWTDFDTQLAFVDHELNSSERSAGDRIRAAATVQEANDGMIMFERPQGSNRGARFAHNYTGRLNYAHQALSGFDGGTYYSQTAAQDLPEIRTTENDVVMAPSPQTYVERNANPEPQGYGFMEGVGANLQSFGITSHLDRWMGESGADPNFIMGEDRAQHLTKTYPSQYHDFLLSSGSEFNLRSREDWVKEDMTRQARMGATGGVSNVAQGLTAGLVDPVPLAIGVATGGLGSAAVGGGRVAQMLYGAVSGAAMNATIDYASKGITDNPYADPLMSGAMGAVFGSIGGALTRGKPFSRDWDALIEHQAAIRQAAIDGSTPEEVLRKWAKSRSNFLASVRAGEAAVPISTGGHVGAARNPRAGDDLIGTDAAYAIEMRDESVPRGYGGILRQDVTGQMTTSNNPLVRIIGANLFEETAGFTDYSVVPDSVNSRFTSTNRMMTGNFNAEYLPARSSYIKEGGLAKLNIMEQARRGEEFDAAVTDYILSASQSVDANPHVVKAAAAFRRGMAEFAKQMNEVGLWQGPADPNYVPLIADHNFISHLDTLIGPETMEKFFKAAIKDHSPHISDEIAAKMAKGYWANIRAAGYGIEDNFSKSLHLNDKEGFKKAFHETLDARNLLTDNELEEVFSLLSGMMDGAKQSEGEASHGISRLKRRTLMNYNFKASVTLDDGSTMELRPRDLFEKNAGVIFHRYSRSMSGRIEFARTKIFNPDNGEIIVNGIKSEGDLDRLINMVRESYRKMPGTLADHRDDMNNAIENIVFGWKKINGIPVYGSESAAAQWVRRIKDSQFIRLMSNMGLNQVQETWKQLSLIGFRASVSQLPSIREMVRGVASGQYSPSKLAQEIEAMTGIGMDNLWSRHALRVEDDRIGASQGGAFTRGLDNALEMGKQVTAKISLHQQIQAFQQRWTAKSIIQKMANMARKARTAEGEFDLDRLNRRERDRLASTGMGDDDLKALFKNLLEHGEFDGDKVVGINTTAWDPATVSKTRVFLNRYTDRIIQQNDFGALSKWMSKPVLSLFTQFRTFVFGAWAKSTLWSINHGVFSDPRMVVMVLGELAMGVATYIVRQSGQLATEDGAEKFWEEYTDPYNLLKNGWSRTATASVLPMFADSLLLFGPGRVEISGTEYNFGPQFGNARSSGSPTDAFLGSPAVDQIKSLAQFSKGALGSALSGEPMTQGAIKAGVRALPLPGNWMPLSVGLSARIEDLPEK
ncbi:phage tail tip lysozyme [Rhizobium sp. KDH_Rht_773_N]